MTNNFPISRRVFATTLGPSDEEIRECKINFREDRLKALLEGTSFVYDPDRHEAKTPILDVKPLNKPSMQLMYFDYIYKGVNESDSKV